jgi:WD40 repeat protein
VTATFEFDKTLKIPPLPITDYVPGKLTLMSCVSKAARSTTLVQPILEEQKVKTDDRVPHKNVGPECQGLETAAATFDFDEKLKLPPRPVTDCAPGQLTLTPCVSKAVKATTQVSKVIKLTPIGYIDLRLSKGDKEKPFYSGIDHLPDGRLVAVDSLNKKFLVYNKELKKVGSYTLSYLPQSVVTVSDEEVAVTSGYTYKLDILRVNKSNRITLDRTYKVKKRYFSISLKDDEHFVCTTVDHSKPVRIVSFNGKEKDFKINFPKKKYPMSSSACTYIRSSDKVVLTDRYDHTVYIYDVKTDTRVVVKDDQIKEPRGVAVGPYDTILVCCLGTHAVVQISQTGQILSSYKPDMENPVCV